MFITKHVMFEVVTQTGRNDLLYITFASCLFSVCFSFGAISFSFSEFSVYIISIDCSFRLRFTPVRQMHGLTKKIPRIKQLNCVP